MMKLKLAVLAAGLALAGGAAHAQTYVEVTGGAVSQPDMGWGGADYEMDTGWNAGLALGWQWKPNIALEGEVFHTTNTYSGYSNDLNSTSFMGNVVYSFRADKPVQPYVGAGAGVVRVEYDYGSTVSDTVFGWQAMAGVRANVSDHFSVFAEYRYQDADDAEGDFYGPLKWEYRSHNYSAGVRYTF